MQNELHMPANLSALSLGELRKIEQDNHTKVLELTTTNVYHLYNHGGGGRGRGFRMQPGEWIVQETKRSVTNGFFAGTYADSHICSFWALFH